MIDSCLILLIIWAIIKGWKQGLVVAAFSFAAVFIGMAAAVKTSAILAKWLNESVNLTLNWLPFLAFILIMIGVTILVRLMAKIVASALEISMMGWLNTLGGIVLYLVLYISIFSVLIFYLEKMNLLNPNAIKQSVGYVYIHYWGPKSIDFFGKAIPVFKNMFEELTLFFDGFSKRIG